MSDHQAGEDRSILIIGGTGVFGRLYARHFAAGGASVAVTARDEGRARDLAAAVAREAGQGGRVVGLGLDLMDLDAIRALPDRLADAGFAATALVNAARDPRNLAVDAAGRPSLSGWQGEYALSVIAPYETTLALAQAPDSRLEAVVNVASMYGVVAPTMPLYGADAETRLRPQYGVAKAAMIHLTRYLAVQLAPRGIRVNAVSYGGAASTADAAFQADYGRFCPQGGMLSDADIPGPVEFLTGSRSRGMTGHNLVVDGGWTAH